nr:MAG TPA: structural protein [Herelleviridae sp.]
MNLFQKYGIKEVSDVVFYSINEIGDEVFYTPVLFLDTLKVSTLEKSAQKVSAQGGKGNKKLITWNYGKEISLNLEDALFSPASMSMIWGGLLESKLSKYTSAIVKCNMANKYGTLHYSIKAYPSPALTDEEWEIVFEVAEENNLDSGSGNQNATKYKKNGDIIESYVAENRNSLIYKYFKRKWATETEKAMPQSIIDAIIKKIDSLDKVGTIETDIHELEVIDRMEKCIVKDRKGLEISTKKQKENLLRYYKDDKTSSYTIFYDAKTMLPLLQVNDAGKVLGWDGDKDDDNDGILEETDKFRIKIGTVYYKWTRTVKYKESEDDGILGRTLVIDAETFPDDYKIVGETYIREQKTGKDQRYQFVIHRANVSSDTSITLQADGDPTTFSMQIDVLTPPNDIQMELKQYNVEDDLLEGGTRIVPQRSKYTYTPTNIDMVESINVPNNEIY